MMNLCMVIEVIQNNIPQRSMVMIPGTHPSTLGMVSVDSIPLIDHDEIFRGTKRRWHRGGINTDERDQD